MKKYLLPQTGNFYKANLHCHSTFSDGCLTPQELKEAYVAKGYSILAYTDHDIMIAHPELQDENFLPLNGYEMEIDEIKDDRYENKKTCHICLIALEPDNLKQVCWHSDKYLFKNAPKYKDLVQFYEDEPNYERAYNPECVCDMMKRGREHGFFVTYNHPTWSQENYDDYSKYHHMHAFEICNYNCVAAGYDEYNPRVYDDLLRNGERIYCIAADDNHNVDPLDSRSVDSFGGFTVIKAEKLEYRTITKALEAGHFYASQGPEIHELWYEDGYIHVKCSPADRIMFNYGHRKAYSKYGGACGTIEYACAPVDADCGYVRVTVIDKCGKPANSNAYFVEDLYR